MKKKEAGDDVDMDGKCEEIEYEVDTKLLKKVERLSTYGYKHEQPKALDWLGQKGLPDMEAKLEKLRQHILVKEDKPSNCYTFHMLIEDLKNKSSEEVVTAIRGKPENLHGKNGFEEIFEAQTRFACIKGFRDHLNETEMKNPGYKKTIQAHDIMLLNPTKPVHTEKLFKYDLLLCPKRPNKKCDDRRLMKERKNLTTS